MSKYRRTTDSRQPQVVKPAFTIECGKRYVMRDGEITGVVEQATIGFPEYPFTAYVGPYATTLSWNEEGQWLSGHEGQMDLIAEYKES